MKTIITRAAFFAAYLVVFLALFSFAACSTGNEDNDDEVLPALTGSVSITGNEGIGYPLTADTSALDGIGTISYQWWWGEVPITGGTDKEYTPKTTDRGKMLLVKVRRAGYTGTISSPPTGEIGDYTPGKKTINASVNIGEAKFYSFSTGQEVNNPASTDWDIGFELLPGGFVGVTGGFNVLTNSGDTADKYDSGGDGGIYPTGLTYFGSVTLADKKEGTIDGFDYTPYQTDKKRWVSLMGVIETTLNVASYQGYDNETTTGVGDAEATPLKGLAYNKFCFWKMPTMGEVVPTMQVYIVKHADGESYSAVQIQGYTYFLGVYNTYTVVVKPLEPLE
jgi:hypothetical protein